MSAYDNVVGGKLKLKGKALDVRAGGVKKKKKQKKHEEQSGKKLSERELLEGEGAGASDEANEEEETVDKSAGDDKPLHCDDQLTPAERRYIEQRQKLDVNKLAKEANKSHRDRIQDFNQYLANMSEHYDIPKVGPG
ncbi:PREDICTED: protein FAM32A [Tarenaya hassleriana]|uniref:protein FAM32A n=1 Tax=Tarenaya hassleriana TaxID=28532 RepID=UPI00053C1AFD|nr:PREDICTED: protein FAM32A [Tarenaya hassleriana]XP_010537741.1 PREDICTED: protein FAM32A [Tarenaya hassleriana]